MLENIKLLYIMFNIVHYTMFPNIFALWLHRAPLSHNLEEQKLLSSAFLATLEAFLTAFLKE